MTQLIHKTGNIWDTEADAIGHGVNTEGLMLSGIALQFREKYPDMHDQYKSLCDDGFFLPGDVFPYLLGLRTDGRGQYIYNIFTQDAPKANARYKWVLMGAVRALDLADKYGVKTLALPRIGSGVGGLEWEKVEPLLEAAASAFDADIEVWTLPA